MKEAIRRFKKMKGLAKIIKKPLGPIGHDALLDVWQESGKATIDVVERPPLQAAAVFAEEASETEGRRSEVWPFSKKKEKKKEKKKAKEKKGDKKPKEEAKEEA